MNRFLFCRLLVVRVLGLGVMLLLWGACGRLVGLDGVEARKAAEAGNFEEIDRRIEQGSFSDLTRLAAVMAQVGDDPCVTRLERIALAKDRAVQLAVFHAAKKLSPDRRRRVLTTLVRSEEEDVRRLASEELSKLNVKGRGGN